MPYTARTADWIIGKAYQVAKAKAAPTTGNKYDTLLDIVDSEYKNWAYESGVDWDSLYDTITLVPVVTATDTFALPDTIRKISTREGDYVRVTNGTQTKQYTVVKPDQLYDYRYKDACAKQGRTLVFSTAFTADSSLLGYSIKVPCFTYVDDIEAGADTVTIDDDMYLPYAVAAEFARNDLIKTSQYDNILAKAEEHMTKMKEDNSGSEETVATAAIALGEDWT